MKEWLTSRHQPRCNVHSRACVLETNPLQQTLNVKICVLARTRTLCMRVRVRVRVRVRQCMHTRLAIARLA